MTNHFCVLVDAGMVDGVAKAECVDCGEVYDLPLEEDDDA